MKNLRDLLEHQVRDLYSTEKQLIEALTKMQDKASDESLKNAFSEHLEETRQQKKRLEDVSQILGMSAEGERCKGIAGIIAEAEDFMKEASEADVLDAGLIANAQRAEHYEIAGYGTACYYADELGYTDAANILRESLREEKSADEILNELAIKRVNQKAEA